MTKAERKRLIKAINHFLADDPDEWQAGIDELTMVVYGKKWSDRLPKGKPVSIFALMQYKEKTT